MYGGLGGQIQSKKKHVEFVVDSICDMGYESRESREECLPNFENRKLCKYALHILEAWNHVKIIVYFS